MSRNQIDTLSQRFERYSKHSEINIFSKWGSSPGANINHRELWVMLKQIQSRIARQTVYLTDQMSLDTALIESFKLAAKDKIERNFNPFSILKRELENVESTPILSDIEVTDIEELPAEPFLSPTDQRSSHSVDQQLAVDLVSINFNSKLYGALIDSVKTNALKHQMSAAEFLAYISNPELKGFFVIGFSFHFRDSRFNDSPLILYRYQYDNEEETINTEIGKIKANDMRLYSAGTMWINPFVMIVRKNNSIRFTENIIEFNVELVSGKSDTARITTKQSVSFDSLYSDGVQFITIQD